ncbi:MAG: hypothetical protein Q7N95_05315 [Alphaproteobacteria bacterium]|nr:hypothetical protein [Alphaproteobacteria bacterium]
MQRFGAVYEDFQKARLGCEEAALMLGCSVRHFLRLRERYDDGGVERLRDGRVGRVARRMRRLRGLHSCTVSGMRGLTCGISTSLRCVSTG